MVLRRLVALLALLTLGCAPACESVGSAAPATAPTAAAAPTARPTRVASPAEPAQAREACAAAGGRCVSVSACAPGKGSISPLGCGRPSVVCCMQGCGEETFSCCAGSGRYRPACVGGKLECTPPRTRCDEPPAPR